jgi:hypothetical protein
MKDDVKTFAAGDGFPAEESSRFTRAIQCGAVSELEEKSQSGRGRRWPKAGTGRRGDAFPEPC